jgi:hypothetical protein
MFYVFNFNASINLNHSKFKYNNLLLKMEFNSTTKNQKPVHFMLNDPSLNTNQDGAHEF